MNLDISGNKGLDMENTQHLPDPVFILGHPKSGTSLLVSLLDNHPELLVLPEETDFYNRVWPRMESLNQEWRRSAKEKQELLCNFILKNTHVRNYLRGKVDKDISGNFDYSSLDKDQLESALRKNIKPQNNYDRAEVLRAIVVSIGGVLSSNTSRTKKFWIEKTPKHTWSLNLIKRDFTDSKFIFIHRDPRDNFASYKKKYDQNYDPFQFSKTWNSAFEQIQDLTSGQLLVVKYEELVSNPANIISKVVEFLGIKENECLYSPSKMGKSWTGNSMFDSSSRNIHNNSTGRFRDKLSEQEIVVIESFCKDEMSNRSDIFAYSEGDHRDCVKVNQHTYQQASNLMIRNKRARILELLKASISGRLNS